MPQEKTKPAVASSGVWGGALAVVGGIVTVLMQPDVQALIATHSGEIGAAAQSGDWWALAAAIAAAVGGAVAIRGRMKAATRIEGIVRPKGDGQTFCHPLPVLAAVGLALLLAGCDPARQERIDAAIDRASERILVACQTLDGAEMTVTVDVLAAAANQTDRLEMVRSARQRACAAVGAIEALAPAEAPLPAPRP